MLGQVEERLPSERQLKQLLKVYSKGLRQRPNDLDLRTKLAEVLRLLGRTDEAIALYSSVAWSHGVAGNLSRAINLCKVILQLSPEHSETQQMLARLYASKQIREEKQSIPVVQVGGKWVADPRGQPGASPAPLPATALESPKEPLRGPPALPPEKYDDKDEVTRDDRPSSPELKARREGTVTTDPNEKVRSPLAVAPTVLKDPVVLTADERGELKLDPAAGDQERARSTLRLPAELARQVRKQLAPLPSLSGVEGPPPADEEPTQLEEELDQPTHPNEQTQEEEPTQLEGSAVTQLDQVPANEPESVSEAIEQASGAHPPTEHARPAARRISTAELQGAEPPAPQVAYTATKATAAGEAPPTPPPQPAEPAAAAPAGQDQGPEVVESEVHGGTDAHREPKSTTPLSAVAMMELAAESMPQRDSRQFQTQAPVAQQPPPAREVERRVQRRTAPGFQMTGELADEDPLRFIRTTTRYATVSADDEPEQTVVSQLDPALVSSVIRLEAASGEQSDALGYAAIQKEVREAGQQQEEPSEPTDREEEQAAEQDLRDTMRDCTELDPLSSEVSLPSVPYPLFSDLDTPAFMAMVQKLERRVCPAGNLLFQEGDPGDSLFLVSSGTLSVLKEDDKGRLIELARLGPGSFFGEFGLLTDRHRHASVRSVDESELLELRRDVLVALIREHPSIAWTLRTFYHQRLMAMVLATSPLFQAVSPEDRKAVLSRFSIKRIMEGETIITEDKPGTGFYVVLVGEVAVSCRAEDGTEIPLGMLSEGDYFGEISLLTGTAAEATVRANTITEVLTLGARDFYDLASTHPEIWAEVQEEAERRQRMTAERQAAQAAQVKAAGPLCLI